MNKLLVSVSIVCAIGLSGLIEAQQPRARSTRPTYRSHAQRAPQHYRPSHQHYRGHYPGYAGYGRYYGGYSGWGVSVGYGYGYGYYGRVYAPSYYTTYNPYYVARAPIVVDTVYTPQYYVREESTGTAVVTPEKVETITLKEGEMIRRGNVIIENRGGKLVMYQAEESE